MKGKRLIGLAVVALLLTAGICVFSWFHVRGAELKLPKDLPEDCTVSVIKDPLYEKREIFLDKGQLSQLLELIQGTSYWRIPSDSISYSEPWTYDILITFDDGTGAQYISVFVAGDYAIQLTSSLDSMPKEGFFRIMNSDWLMEMEAIMTS